MTAGSVPATARNTTAPVVYAKGRRRRIWRSRLMPSSPTPRSRSAELAIMAHSSPSYEPSTGIEKWIDERLPVPRLMHDQFLAFPTPRNLNYWWTFGGILTFMLVSQIATGVVLAMDYIGTAERAFYPSRANAPSTQSTTLAAT